MVSLNYCTASNKWRHGSGGFALPKLRCCKSQTCLDKAVGAFIKARLDGVFVQILRHRVLFVWQCISFGNAIVFDTSGEFLIHCKICFKTSTAIQESGVLFYRPFRNKHCLCNFWFQIFQWISFEELFCMELFSCAVLLLNWVTWPPLSFTASFSVCVGGISVVCKKILSAIHFDSWV